MEGVLPEEFPFSAKREVVAPVEPAPAPTPQPASQSLVSLPEIPAPVAAPAPRVERLEVESLVEVAGAGGHIVYRGRERRRSPRQALRAKAVYRDEINTVSSGPVQVINISMFGLRVWTSRPLRVGDRGSIRLELGPLKWSSMVRIVSANSNEDDGFVMGCEFVAKELPRRRVDAA